MPSNTILTLNFLFCHTPSILFLYLWTFSLNHVNCSNSSLHSLLLPPSKSLFRPKITDVTIYTALYFSVSLISTDILIYFLWNISGDQHSWMSLFLQIQLPSYTLTELSAQVELFFFPTCLTPFTFIVPSSWGLFLVMYIITQIFCTK